MWTTRDGYTLRLPRSRLPAVAAGLRRALPQDGSPAERHRGQAGSILSTIVQLVRGSSRAGSMYHPASAAEYPVFRGSAGEREFELITQPVLAGGNAILAVRPAPLEDQPEFLANISGDATITWEDPRTFTGAIRDGPTSTSDVYVLEKRHGGNWVPYYVGRTDDPSDRLQDHRRDIMRHRGRLSDYRVRVGHIAPASSLTPAHVERVLIRKVRRAATGVTNAGPDARPFLVPQGQRVEIRHQGNVPRYTVDRRRRNRTLIVPGGRQYELV